MAAMRRCLERRNALPLSRADSEPEWAVHIVTRIWEKLMTIDANMRPSDAVVYDLEIPDVLEVLRTTENGLPSDEARQRFLAHGPNELQALARTSPLAHACFPV